MKKQIIGSLFILMVLVLTNSCGQDNKNIQIVKPAKFEAMLKSDPNIVLLDVRTQEEYNSGAIAKSVNIDFYADDFATTISKLDKSKTYLVYCRSGKRSNKTANMLSKQGCKNIFDLDGGITAWTEARLPVEIPLTK